MFDVTNKKNKLMKHLLQIFVLISIVGIFYGLYIKAENPQSGHLYIGLSLVLLIFITMPIFIFRRWKNKDVKDYMLTKENIKKMRDFNDSKE
tara:strand:+ start:95315 stop:95590 length:276 start_codon:yes stop_codon:yes gene_type:complete